MKEKGGVEEGDPSEYNPSQNPVKQRGGEEDGERKVLDCCPVIWKLWLTDGKSLRQPPI